MGKVMKKINKRNGQSSGLSPAIAINKPLVSLIVPAFNEAKIITKSLTTLSEYMKMLEGEYLWELIIVNDGSTDKTGDLAEAFAKDRDNVYVLHHMYNFRLGQALRFAFSKCEGDYIVVIDADLSYSPDHIGLMLEKIKKTRAKIVIASPYTKGGKVTSVPWARKLLSRWANQFLSFFATRDRFSDKLTTITGMVRTYDGEFLRRLNLKAMDVDINPEIIYKAKILRARIVEVPAHLHWMSEKNDDGKPSRRQSNLALMRTVLQSFLSGFIFRPFMFYLLPGFTIIVLALYPLVWSVIHTVHHYKRIAYMNLAFDNRLSGAIGEAFRQSPHSFIVGGVALLVGIQLISLGLLALQKKRYFDELFHLSSSIYRNTKTKKKIEKT
jgi:glycosyltransferase involved in cell wall biosynthesis